MKNPFYDVIAKTCSSILVYMFGGGFFFRSLCSFIFYFSCSCPTTDEINDTPELPRNGTVRQFRFVKKARV